MKKIVLLLSTLGIVTLTASGFGLMSSSAYAATSSNPLDSTCNVEGAQQSSLCQNKPDGSVNPIGGSGSILSKVINLALIGAGIAAVIMIIIGGLEYVMSAGDSKKIETGKSTIIFALIGLVIVFTAEIILKLVVRSL